MAPRQRLTHNDHTISPEDIVDAEAIPVAPDAISDKQELEDDILSGLDADTNDVTFTISVYRINKGGRKPEYCGQYSPADMSEQSLMDTIAADHGGGLFRVRVYRNGRLYRNREIQISPTVKRKESAPTTSDGRALESVVNTLNQVVLEQRNAPKQSSLMETAAALAPFAPVFVALIDKMRPSNGVEMLTGIIGAVAQLKELSGEASPAREKSPMEIVADVVTKSPLLGMINGVPTQIPQQAQPPQIQAPTQPTPEQLDMEQVKFQINYLVGRAKNNSSPELYAEFVLDNVPGSFLKYLHAPNALDIIASIQPDVLRFRQWFETLIQYVQSAETNAPDDSAETYAPETRNSPAYNIRFADGTDGHPSNINTYGSDNATSQANIRDTP